MAGAAPSAVRAVIMFAVLLGAGLLLRTYDSLCALALAGILMLLESPALLFASGFQLSFCAVLAVSLCWPALSWLLPPQVKKPEKSAKKAGLRGKENGVLYKRSLRRWLRYYRRLLLRYSCFWLVITGTMVPLTAWYYCEISVWGLLPNLLLIPAAPVLLVSGALGLLLGCVSLQAGKLVLLPAEWILKGIRFLTDRILELPSATYVCGKPELWQMVLSGMVLAAVTAFLLNRKAAAERAEKRERQNILKDSRKPAAAGAVLFLLVILIRITPLWSLTMLDVGQGDALVLRDRSACFLIDGGSSSVKNAGTYRILPYLKSRGISRLDGIFVSHPDEDHMNGILELLEAVEQKQATLQVETLYLPLWMKGTEEEAELIEAASGAGTEVAYLAKGDLIRSRTIEIQVLYPFYEGGIRSGNSGSMVLSVSCGEFDALLTGDLESDGEKLLLPLEKTYDYLKVGHHGSKGSSSEQFLQQVQPVIAAVSAPENSQYGHPHQETIDRLTEAGAEIYVTRDCGAVTVEGSRKKWRLCGYLGTEAIPH